MNIRNILVKMAKSVVLTALGLMIILFFAVNIFEVDPKVEFTNMHDSIVNVSIRQGRGVQMYEVESSKSIYFKPNGEHIFAIYASLPEDHIMNCKDKGGEELNLNVFSDDASCCVLTRGSCSSKASVYSKKNQTIEYFYSREELGRLEIK